MTQTKIQKLYQDNKSRGFVNHLIKAYMPTSNITKVWEFTTGQSKKCNICSIKLMSVEDSLNSFYENKEVIMDGVISNMKAEAEAFFDDNKTVPKTENPIKKHVTKGRVLAFTGQKTDTCLCLQCSEDLLDMVQSGLLMNDSNISYQINQIHRNQVFNKFTESKKLNADDKESVKQIKKKVDKKKTATFGDLAVLKELKLKMENNE